MKEEIRLSIALLEEIHPLPSNGDSKAESFYQMQSKEEELIVKNLNYSSAGQYIDIFNILPGFLWQPLLNR